MKRVWKIAAAAIALTLAAGIPVAVSAAAEEASVQHYFRTVETDAEGWTWDGFSLIENDKASRSWEHGTYSAGAAGEYRFKGKAAEIVGCLSPEGGTLRVQIDGEDKGSVSLYAKETEYRATLATFAGLSEDWHTIRIESAEEGKWHAVDAIRVDMPKEVYIANYNLALVGEIICSVPEPTGGGNRDLNVVRNEKIYPVGTTGAGPAQYDSFCGSGRGYFYMGYSFAEELPFSKLVFQEGDTWFDGGWFSDGDIKVQVRKDGAWKDVTLTEPVGYPVSDAREDFGQSCEIYTFSFEKTAGDAIRLIGMTGGTSNFVSVSQIEVYAEADAKTLEQGYDYRAATVYELEEETEDEPGAPSEDVPEQDPPQDGNGKTGLIVGLSVGGAAVAAGAVTGGVLLYKKNRKKQ